MAYMSQEHKKRIADQLKKVVPKGWKYSLAVRHHSTICMTIRSANVDLLAAVGSDDDHIRLTPHSVSGDRFQDENILCIFRNIMDALNLDNHDRSDIMVDHFDVGHYINLNIGTFDKPFTVK